MPEPEPSSRQTTSTRRINRAKAGPASAQIQAMIKPQTTRSSINISSSNDLICDHAVGARFTGAQLVRPGYPRIRVRAGQYMTGQYAGLRRGPAHDRPDRQHDHHHHHGRAEHRGSQSDGRSLFHPGAVTALTPNCMAPSKAAALPARCALVSSATC